MVYDTAVFWDIENMTGGYAFGNDGGQAELVRKISLKTIMNDLRGSAHLDGCAVNRAYADWSNPALAFFRPQLHELGIEPVQVYGFSGDNTKNAADFHIVTDAIDLVHLRPSLETFVFVTGDGGFSAVVKRLREYGKRVVGYGYRSRRSRVLAAVCEHYMTMPNPLAPSASSPSAGRSAREETLRVIASALKQLTDDPAAVALLRGDGLPLSEFDRRVKATHPGFDAPGAGFRSLSQAVKEAVTGTRMTVRAGRGGRPRLFLDAPTVPPRGGRLSGFWDDDEEGSDGHESKDVPASVHLTVRLDGPHGGAENPGVPGPAGLIATGLRAWPKGPGARPSRPPDETDDRVEQEYRSALREGCPTIVLPPPDELRRAAAALAGKHLKQKTAQWMVGFLSNDPSHRLSPDALENAIHAFELAGAFDRESTATSPEDVYLTLLDDYATEAALLTRLHEAVVSRLNGQIRAVRDDIVRRLVP